jgi:penicillin amidase
LFHSTDAGFAVNSSFPLLTRFILFLGLPVVILVVAVILHFRGSLPPQQEQLAVAGLQASVEILRNAQGVPHIKAKTDRDVYFAMGYTHAQDRLWQLEIQRRVGSGRLSEIFGAEALQRDIWLRSLGLRESAQTDWPSLSPTAQQSLLAYAEGINAWLATHPTLPPEFALLDVRPEPWSPLDSLTWIKIFSLNLSGNFGREVSHYLAARQLNEAELKTFFPDHSHDLPVTGMGGMGNHATPDRFAALFDLHHKLETELHIGGKFVGSNAWVVAGKHSKNGLAMLANDPHLSLQIPSLWYPVVQSGDQLQSSGMSLVGLPLVIFGQNEHIAWGGTAMTADVQDLFFEQTDPHDPDRYRVGDGWQRFISRTETIRVKPDFPAMLRKELKPVQVTIRSTRNGPIVSDIIPGFEQPVALRWTALAPRDASYESFFRLNYAHDWASFRDALKNHVAPALNLLFADQQGNIGFQAIGRIPLRAKGKGAMPSPGWSEEFAWAGSIPFEAMPHSFNPPKGYIVSANNRITDDQYPYFISNDWAPPGRAQRITDLLEKIRADGTLFTAEAFQRMQADTLSLPALQLAGLLAQLEPGTERQKQAIDYLKTWDGDMRTNSQGASIFNAWSTHLREQLFENRTYPDWNRRSQSGYLADLGAGLSLEDLYALLRDPVNPWCRPKAVGKYPACQTVALLALDRALDELEKLMGGNMASWHWGEAHHTLYSHTPFSNIKLLDKLFERRIENGGSPDTINVATLAFLKSEGYQQLFGAGFRQIIEIGGAQKTSHWYMNSTGQSGNIFSSHYADMIEPFQAGKYVSLNRRRIEAKDGLTRLLPLKKGQ